MSEKQSAKAVIPVFSTYASREMIQKCLTCKRKVCTGNCPDEYLQAEKRAKREEAKARLAAEREAREAERIKREEEKAIYEAAKKRWREKQQNNPRALCARKLPEAVKKKPQKEANKKPGREKASPDGLYRAGGEALTLAQWAERCGVSVPEMQAALCAHHAISRAIRHIKYQKKVLRYTAYGETHTLTEWAELCETDRSFIAKKLRFGGEPEEVFKKAKAKIEKGKEA